MKGKVKILLGLVCMLLGMGSTQVIAGTTTQNISVNTSYSGYLASSGDVCQYNFTLSSAGKINISFSHANISSTSNYWKIEIYNQSQECVMRMYSAGTETFKTGMDVGLAAGSYYVKVSQEYYSSTNYNLKVNYTASNYWESETNNGYGTADNITVNTSYSGANQFGSDDDYYKFTLNKSGKVNVKFQHPTLNDNSTYWKVNIYNEQTENLLEMSVRGTDINITSAELGLAAGNYYLFVDTYYYDSSTYTFEVTYTESNYWEAEVNDGYGTANNIALNANYSGANQFGNDEDYYKFSLDSAGKVSINFQHPVLKDNSTYWKLYVYNEQTDMLLYRDIKGTEYNITTAELGIPAGNYYFVVETYYYSSETYTFKLNYSASATWETEANDGYGSADNIEIGMNYNGAIQESGDDDYYKFQLNSASDIKINFQHPNLNDNSCYWQIYLYNASTEKLAEMDSCGMETSISSETITLPAGTYYVHVRPYYTSPVTYTLNVNYSYAGSKPALELKYQAYNRIKISWNQSGSGNGYVIYRSTSRGGTYQVIKTITNKKTTSYTDSNVKAGKTYYYRVRPYKTMGGQQYYGTFSSIVKAKAAPEKVKISSVKAGASKATITWKKQSNISGYEIYMSSQKNGKYKKIKTVTKPTTVKYSKTKLASGKRYYFKVRAYKKVNGKKVYGDFSSIKSVKITR